MTSTMITFAGHRIVLSRIADESDASYAGVGADLAVDGRPAGRLFEFVEQGRIDVGPDSHWHVIGPPSDLLETIPEARVRHAPLQCALAEALNEVLRRGAAKAA